MRDAVSNGPDATDLALAPYASRQEPGPGGAPAREISLFGLDIRDTTIEEAARWIIARASRAEPTQISFLNADCVNILHRQPAYRDALEQADSIFADGIGVRLAARLAGHHLHDNVNGTDLFPVLCRMAAGAGVGIFLFGARDGRAQASAENMQRIHPGLVIAGCHHGYLSDEADEARVIAEINDSGADILLVALGAPAQELWIARNRARLRPAVIVGVGGLFDYYSGYIRRAPLPFRRAGMEWLWRLAMEPRRLARRYIVGNAEFLIRITLSAFTQHLPESHVRAP
jgi:exopolysaccharide biosynthesis WecB/TagA/CpsF family protein